jgi:3-deoxy-D-manno-octulosonic-acid transferase
MLIKLYQIVSFLALPLIKLYFMLRLSRQKESSQRYKEKFGQWTLPRPQGKLFWVHAASVGELLAVLPLLKEAEIKWPNVRFLVTTVTVTSAEVFAKQNLTNCLHQFAPVDSYYIVRKFFTYWQPDLAIFTESELWPNSVLTAKKFCPTVLLNARLSDKSYHLWQKFLPLVKAMVEAFDLIIASSELDKSKYTQLGAKNIHNFGNLKEAALPLPADEKLLSELQIACKDREVWLASSTHAGEEEIILAAHKELRHKYPALLTIIAPRHPARGAEIQALCNKNNLISSLRSLNERIDSNTEAYVANTIGELGILYRLADIVYVGGSLVKHGGQNIMEPARLDCALITGPHTFNFIESIAALKGANAIIEVQNQSELIEAVLLLLSNKSIRSEMQLKAKQVTYSKREMLTSVIKLLEDYTIGAIVN